MNDRFKSVVKCFIVINTKAFKHKNPFYIANNDITKAAIIALLFKYQVSISKKNKKNQYKLLRSNMMNVIFFCCQLNNLFPLLSKRFSQMALKAS